jgi:Zn finger protein HypA/HybF involved in hydrogenase expression
MSTNLPRPRFNVYCPHCKATFEPDRIQNRYTCPKCKCYIITGGTQLLKGFTVEW